MSYAASPLGAFLRVMARPWLVAWTSLVATVVLLGFQGPFPSGSDGGHMLAFSQWFVGSGLHPAWTYAPAMPAVYGALDVASLGSDAVLHALIKAWTLVSFLAGGLLVAAAARLLGGTEGATRATFAVYLVGPLVPFINLWGDTAQLWGFGFAALAVAALIRSTDGGSAATASWSIAILAYTHWYSLVYATLTCLGYLLWRLARQPRASGPWVARLARASWPAALATIPAAWMILFRTRPLLKPSGFHGVSWAELHRLTQALLPNPFHVAVLVAWILVLIAAAFSGSRTGRPVATLAAMLVVGMALLFVVTPVDIVDRVVFFATLPLALWLGETAGQATRTPAAILVAAVAAGGLVSGVAYLHDAAYFSPLDEESAHAYDVLAGADGGVLVVSPQPNIDAWWMEAKAGRISFVYDQPRFYSFQNEIERGWHARALSLGNAGWKTDGQWWLADGGTIHALAPLGDALEIAVRVDGPGDVALDAHAGELTADWSMPGSVVVQAPPGGWFDSLAVGDQVEIRTRWLHIPEAGPPITLHGDWGRAEISEDKRLVSLHWDVVPSLSISADDPRAWDVAAEADAAGIRAVYLRAPEPGLLGRWLADRCATQVYQEADVWVMRWHDC